MTGEDIAKELRVIAEKVNETKKVVFGIIDTATGKQARAFNTILDDLDDFENRLEVLRIKIFCENAEEGKV